MSKICSGPKMIKLIVLVMICFFLLGCQLIEKSPIIAFRSFEMIRDSKTLLPTNIKSDIPNSFLCEEVSDKTIFEDLNFKETVFYGYSLENGDDGFKKLEIDTVTDKVHAKDPLVDEILGNDSLVDDYLDGLTDPKNLGYFLVSYNCVDKSLVLNESLNKSFSVGSDELMLDRIWNKLPSDSIKK